MEFLLFHRIEDMKKETHRHYLRHSTIGAAAIIASSSKTFARSFVNEKGFIDLFGGKAGFDREIIAQTLETK